MRSIVTVLSAAVMGFVMYHARPSEPAAPQERQFWVKIVFGVDGQADSWDGRIDVRDGTLLEIDEWALEERDSVDAGNSSWKITTGVLAARRITQAEPMRGVMAKIRADAKTRVAVTTKQGDFEFAPLQLTPGRPSAMLDGRATVEPLGGEELVWPTETDDDFTTVAVDDRGQRHVAWIAYDDKNQTDRLWIRDVDQPDSDPEPVALAREFTDPHLFAGPDGRLRAVYCSPGIDANWDVYFAVRNDDGWHSKRITSAEGTDFQLAADQGPDGTLWLVWQSFRNGNGDVYARCLRDGAWSDEIAVTDGPADQWEPAVSVGPDGRAWIGYDTYEHGNYDVYLTWAEFDGQTATVGERTAVALSQDFEAHASVLAGDDGRVWVTYDAAGPNWGKDFRNRATITDGTYAEPLHASRRIELRLVDDNQVFRPSRPFPQKRPPDRIHLIDRSSKGEVTRFYEFPQLARDGDGRMWVLFRQCRQGYAPHPPKGLDWNIYATSFTGQGWLEPIQLPQSQGRQNQRVAFDVGADGRLVCAWADGNRFASVNRKYEVHCGTLPAIFEAAEPLPVEPIEVDSPGTPDPAPPPPFSMLRGDEEYHVYYGDLHRHTNISRCAPTIDGCLTDAHRYALNAVQYDFLAVTDHTRDVDAFSWWRTQKACDLFHVPGRYVPIYGYERSNFTPGGGHRNVFFLKRGYEVNASDHYLQGRGLPQENRDPDKTLYPWLRERGGLTAAHTPVYSDAAGRGTWTYNDPQVEPVAEVYQSFRRSYERPGSGVTQEASLWHALKKGHRLGFIASSDHLATHTSYACVWAKEKTREAIFEALSARRTFAATDRIALDVRIGDALMGEETRHRGETVQLKVHASGTAPIQEIQVVRSGTVISTTRPGDRNIQTEIDDPNPLPGTSYYYVRLVQQDGAIAWGSPIWVTR